MVLGYPVRGVVGGRTRLHRSAPSRGLGADESTRGWLLCGGGLARRGAHCGERRRGWLVHAAHCGMCSQRSGEVETERVHVLNTGRSICCRKHVAEGSACPIGLGG